MSKIEWPKAYSEGIVKNDLNLFVEAMKNEYLKHYPNQGDSWKTCEVEWLNTLASRSMLEFFEDKNLENPDHLLDVANFCAFLWLRLRKTRDNKEVG